MAIGRVAGPALFSNLDRQGVDLQFSTDNSPLLYLDFASFKAAINANTYLAAETFTVNGNVKLANVKIDGSTVSSIGNITIAPTENLILGDVANVKIGGGGANYVMTTDGASNLTWKNLDAFSQSLSVVGTNVTLGAPIDGSLVVNSAYRYWTSNTSVTDAVDNLNQVMLNVYKNTYVGAVEFTANVVTGQSPMTVHFTSTVLGNPTTYFWDFGDGNTSSSANPTHTYSNVAGGVYSVYLKASNVGGTLAGAGTYGDPLLAQGSYADLSRPDYITMHTPVPVASFTLNNTSINNLSTVQLVNTSINSTSYVVNWGDGSSTVVPDNVSIGGPSGLPLSHSYSNAAGDTAYNITLSATSLTANPPSGLTVTSPPTTVYVYSTQTPAFTANKTSGNNQHNTLPNGLVVTFSNTTTTLPGATSIFTSNRYEWNFGDGTVTTVPISSGLPGDTGMPISHAFVLSDPQTEQTFTVYLQIYSGYSTSPFTSNSIQITVYPAPTAVFVGSTVINSDRIGDTAQTGYLFTDLSGADRSLISFTNSSINADAYRWQFGDGTLSPTLAEGDAGSVLGGPIAHPYTATGNFNITLLATGPSSITPTDDTLVKTSYIQILPAPIPPAGLSSKVLQVATVGASPLLAANATINTIVAVPPAGSPVQRQTTVPTMIETNLLSNVYNADTGIMSAVVNGVFDTPFMLSGANDVGTYGALSITEDKDAHVSSPTIYPSNFYKVFSGKIAKPNVQIPVGINSFKMAHSTTGDTNSAIFVKDNVIVPPTINNGASLSAASGTPLTYISGVPYFAAGSVVLMNNMSVYDWIGQTYKDTTTPMTVTSGTVFEGVGPLISPKGLTYNNINVGPTFMSSGIPLANTGENVLSPFVFGSIPVVIDSGVAASGKFNVSMSNVNGNSTTTQVDTVLNIYSTPIIGFDETNIPVSPSLGGTYTDNGKRIYFIAASGPTPGFNPTSNFYTDYAFVGATPSTSNDEAVARYGVLAHNTTDYSTYVPPGPNLSVNTGIQYFRFAFRRSVVANFTVTITGKISGLWIAAPNTSIMDTSTLAGWLDASQVYAGAGIPGANVSNGGNGSNGCAKTAGDVVIVGQYATKSYTLTLGSENTSNATGNNILVSIALDVGDTVTSISIS